eukprot:gene6236-16154_t
MRAVLLPLLRCAAAPRGGAAAATGVSTDALNNKAAVSHKGAAKGFRLGDRVRVSGRRKFTGPVGGWVLESGEEAVVVD